MKNLKIILSIVVLFSLTVKSQEIPLYNNSIMDVENAYYKDITNIRDQFVGTWVYSNGLEEFKVRFIKIDHFYRSTGMVICYADYLVGEIQYKNSIGVQKISSFSNLNVLHDDIHSYSMFSGPYIINRSAPQCMSCPLNTRRLYMFYTEPDIDDMTLKGMWAMRVKIENGITKLFVQFQMDEGSIGISKFDYSQNAIKSEHDVPYGEYVFIKE